MSDVRLSVAYIGPKSRTDRARKTKIGIEIAHVTHDSDTTIKVKRSKVKVTSRFTHRRVGASGGCSGGRENVLAVGNCCYVAVCSAAEGASAPTAGGEGRGHTVAAARLQLVFIYLQ